MSTHVAIRNLQIIVALDSLCYGLIYCFLPPYILKLGGSHVSVGVLAVSNFIGELLSADITKIITHLHGKRYTLFFILNVALVTHLMMVLTCSYWFTILVRFLFSITNQSQNMCLELLLNKTENGDTKEKLQRNYSMLSGSGYIVGPIISGYIFGTGFGYTGALVAFLTLINITLLMKVNKDGKDINPEHTDKSVLVKASEKVAENVNELKKCNLKKHWDILSLKYLFAASLIIFFSKFPQILKHNYNANFIRWGYTISYINILVFAASYYVVIAKLKTQQYPLLFVTEASFLLTAILMLLACYAPHYELFMLLLIPIVFLRTYIITLWNDLFSERKNQHLINLNNSISVVAGLTIPLLFGMFCNQIAHNAVILFSCAPMFLCWAILKWYSKFLVCEDLSTESKKDS